MPRWPGIVPAVKSALRFVAYGGEGIVVGRPWRDDWYWGGPYAGYDYHAAAGPLHLNAVVMACASWIMRAFAEAPPDVKRTEARTGEENTVENHPLVALLKKPNRFYAGDTLWQRVVFDRSIYSNAYLYKIRNGSGKVTELWHVPQQRIIPQWAPTGKEFIDHYLLVVDAKQTKIPVEDLVHFRFGGDPLNERMGLASLQAAAREIAALNEGANYRGAILNRLGVPSHLLQSKDAERPLNDVQAKALHELWRQRVGGKERGSPLIPSFPLEAVKLGFSPQELDLGPMLNWDTDSVCAQFGLSSQVVSLTAGNEAKTYANYREAREAATENALVPAWKQMGEELTLQLLPDFSDDDAEHVVFDISQVRALQEDETEKWARIDSAIKTGFVLVNEGRAMINLPPVEGGDVFLPAAGETPLSLATASAGLAAAGGMPPPGATPAPGAAGIAGGSPTSLTAPESGGDRMAAIGRARAGNGNAR